MSKCAINFYHKISVASKRWSIAACQAVPILCSINNLKTVLSLLSIHMITSCKRGSALKTWWLWKIHSEILFHVLISEYCSTWILKDQIGLSSDSHRLLISSGSTDSRVGGSGCVWARRAPPRWGRDGGRKGTQRVTADGSCRAATTATAPLWSTTAHLKCHLNSSH